MAFRALVSCLLSAQSRDSNTAKAKNALFALADTPAGILALDDRTIAEAVKPAGLYNMKTRNLKRLCTSLIDDYDEVVPRDRSGLMALPGIGRKCADIMLSFSFGEPVLAVDTHVHRVANRIGLRPWPHRSGDGGVPRSARAALGRTREPHVAASFRQDHLSFASTALPRLRAARSLSVRAKKPPPDAGVSAG